MTDEAGADRSARRRRIVLCVCVAVLVLVIDVTTKIVAMAHLSDRPPVPLFGGLLTLQLVRNSGAAFGLAEGYTVILSLVALGVVVVVIRLSRTLRSTPWAMAFGLLLGGALGNLSDRIFRSPGVLRGHVVDFLQLPHWPVFNAADASICLAAAVILVMALRGRSWDGSVERSGGDDRPDSGGRPVVADPQPRPADGEALGTPE